VIAISINGQSQAFDVPPDMPLLWVLRDVAGLTGTKFGCGIAQCGACTVHVDGVAVRSCVLPVTRVVGRQVTTIEAIAQNPIGQHIQQAWLGQEVIQCGYCQSGQVMSATALMMHKPQPTDGDIDVAMSGNICRCGTYARIREAIHSAATQAAQAGSVADGEPQTGKRP
jgi:isoquinoline 1-oxidoreductase alpha subunit